MGLRHTLPNSVGAMVTTPRKQFQVAVIGGGLGGLCLAIGLVQRGISVQVYEGASSWTDGGAGLVFAKNAMAAMEKISPAIREAFAKRSSGQGWDSKKTTYMDYRNGLTNGELIASVVCANTGQESVHRTLFAKDLVALTPDGTFHMGRKLTHIENREDGRYLLKFADGMSVDTDVVVGADGIKSRCRQIFFGENSAEACPKYTKESAYRGMVPMERAVAVLGDEFARNSMVNIGPGCLTTTYPVEKGTLLNLVACRSLEKWEHDEWVIPSNSEALKRDFVGCGPVMQKVISLMDKPSIWALFDHPECSTFYKKNFALIGDAAHASTPHQGAGCGQALEDALVMCSLLADESVVLPGHVEHAFAAYDAIRRPRALKVVQTSRENGEICMMRGESTGEDLDKIKANLNERFNWIWHEDLDQQVESAIAKLHENLEGLKPCAGKN
nr:FAD-dependent oxidoreductase [Cladonia metacorallifera]